MNERMNKIITKQICTIMKSRINLISKTIFSSLLLCRQLKNSTKSAKGKWKMKDKLEENKNSPVRSVWSSFAFFSVRMTNVVSILFIKLEEKMKQSREHVYETIKSKMKNIASFLEWNKISSGDELKIPENGELHEKRRISSMILRHAAFVAVAVVIAPNELGSSKKWNEAFEQNIRSGGFYNFWSI